MHTYDPDRHTWRYDVGGYAWDNSELSPDLWLWYQYLRTGRADVFRFAEAMTRHTGEVDVYHLGRWKGLGTRHNVQHWGCSCKQLRISSAVYRRHLLLPDRRRADRRSARRAGRRPRRRSWPSTRCARSAPTSYTPDPHALSVGLGTDWGALAAAWLTGWERHGDEQARDRLLGTMADIGALPHGFLTGEARLDLDTGRFDTTRDAITVSHLSAVFGLAGDLRRAHRPRPGPAGVRTGLAGLLPALPGARPSSRRPRSAEPLSGISLVQAHSRLAAYAAARTGDADLAGARLAHVPPRRSATSSTRNAAATRDHLAATRISRRPGARSPVDEAPFVSTNDAAQYGLAAIQLLALVPHARPR